MYTQIYVLYATFSYYFYTTTKTFTMKRILLLLLLPLFVNAQNTTTLPSGTSAFTPQFRVKTTTPDSLNNVWMYNPLTAKYNQVYTATQANLRFALAGSGAIYTAGYGLNLSGFQFKVDTTFIPTNNRYLYGLDTLYNKNTYSLHLLGINNVSVPTPASGVNIWGENFANSLSFKGTNGYAAILNNGFFTQTNLFRLPNYTGGTIALIDGGQNFTNVGSINSGSTYGTYIAEGFNYGGIWAKEIASKSNSNFGLSLQDSYTQLNAGTSVGQVDLEIAGVQKVSVTNDTTFLINKVKISNAPTSNGMPLRYQDSLIIGQLVKPIKNTQTRQVNSDYNISGHGQIGGGLIVGDSITIQTDTVIIDGDSNTLGTCCSTITYAGIWGQRVNMTVVNNAANGATLQHSGGSNSVEDRLSLVPTYRPTIRYYAAMGGTNDLDGNLTISGFTAAWNTIIANLVTKGYPKNRIVVLSPVLMGANAYGKNRDSIYKYVQAAQAVAKTNSVRYIDVFRYMVDHGAGSLLIADSIHLNNAGQLSVADALTYGLSGGIKAAGPIEVVNGDINVYKGGVNSNGIGIAGNLSKPSWGLNGIQTRVQDFALLNNSTSSGTISDQAIHVFGIPALTASSATTITNSYNVIIKGNPISSTNITQSRSFALGVEGRVYAAGPVQIGDKAPFGSGEIFQVTGDIKVSGSIIGGLFSGPGTGLTGTASGLNIGGNSATATSATSATTAGTVTTAAQPLITSVGTLTGLTVTNPITGSVTGNSGTVTNGVYTSTFNTLGDARYLKLTGGNLSGQLQLNYGSPVLNFVNTASSSKTWRLSSNTNDFYISEIGVSDRMKFSAGGQVNLFGKLLIGGFSPTTGAPELDVTGSIGSTALTASQLVATDANKVLVSVTALPSGTTATTQSANDNSTKVATTAYVDAAIGLVGSGQQTGITGSFGNLATAITIPSDGTYSVGGWINITSYTSGSVKLYVTWTDESNTARSGDFYSQGSVAAPITSATVSYFPPMIIHAKAGTSILVNTTGLLTNTYNAGATIHKIN